MQKLGKRPISTFIVTFKSHTVSDGYYGSGFEIEGKRKDVVIPSAILRRNFPQAKTNTRLKMQFYPWEVDVGRTIWIKDWRPCGQLCYTFSRRGKVITSAIPYPFQNFLRRELKIKRGDTLKLKIMATAI